MLMGHLGHSCWCEYSKHREYQWVKKASTNYIEAQYYVLKTLSLLIVFSITITNRLLQETS